MDEQRGIQATSTPAISTGMNVATGIVVQDDGVNIKEEWADTDMDVGPTVLQHTVHSAAHYSTVQLDVSIIKQESRIKDNHIDHVQCCGVKKEIIEDARRADTDDQRSNKAEQLEQRARSQLYSCDECVKTYASKHSLLAHYRNLHSTESHECTRCKKIFPSKAYLYNHTNYAHSEQQYECAVCKKIYRSKAALNVHHYNAHRPRPAADTDAQRSSKAAQSVQRARSQSYSCGTCGKRYTTKYSLLSHYRNQHSTEFHECAKCDRKFPSKAYLYRHTITAHSEQQYECAVCKKICSSKLALNKHVYKVHRPRPAGSEPRIYICHYCRKKFKNINNLTGHITCVHANICGQCNRSFRCERYLMTHVARVHTAGSHQRHTCTNCGKNFKLKWHCQRHEKRGKCARPTASNTSVVASTSLQQPNLVIVKEEPADGELELGPVVFQHMDCNYRPYKQEPRLD